MFLKTERLNIRHIEPDDWKSIKEIWIDFNTSSLSHNSSASSNLFNFMNIVILWD